MAKRGAGLPKRVKGNYPQKSSKGKIGKMFGPPVVRGNGPPTRSPDKYPQGLTGGSIPKMYKPPM